MLIKLYSKFIYLHTFTLLKATKLSNCQDGVFCYIWPLLV